MRVERASDKAEYRHARPACPVDTLKWQNGTGYLQAYFTLSSSTDVSNGGSDPDL